MTQKENTYNIEDLVTKFEPPVMVLSTFVGRGMYYIGEAVKERFSDNSKVYHFPIEDF